MPAKSTDPVAVIGASGALGFGLSLRLARTGVPIAIGSRDPDRARETAARAEELLPEGEFSAHDNAGAASAAGTVILSVPFRNQSETLANIAESLQPGQLFIDATVPLAAAVAGKATRMLGVWQGSAAQQALEMVPDGVRVVSALHTVSAASLSDLEVDLDQDVLVCGDKRADKREAAELIDRIPGLRCVDCGRLENSRTTEALTALLIAVNARYKIHSGIKLTRLPERLWE
ncbi:MAG TPA: NADPH-dependent F420 reductase [Solirubrobacteraceae bacterium]|nr:NADPH-dependent F420 reductase [Solirubrobacteraceae bacterium]